MNDLGKTSRSHVVCVLGMHRSGTSPVTRLLDLLGVNLGPEEHLMRPGPDNPKGFWEHQLITDLNDEILSRHGGSWHEPPAFSPGWENAPELADLRTRARALIQQDFAAVDLWGWKDPRTCLTLPFWQWLVPGMRYVICLRNPADVARSLERRNEFSFEKGIHLWFAHMTSALRHTSGCPRLFISYERLMKDRTRVVGRLADFLGGAGTGEPQAIRQAVEEMLEEDLRHHRTSLVDTADDRRLNFSAKALYMVLRPLAAYPQENTELEVEEATLEKAIDAFSAYALKDAIDQGEQCQLQGEHELLKGQLVEREQQAQAMQAQLVEREQQAQAMQAQLVERDDEIRSLNIAISRVMNPLRPATRLIHIVLHPISTRRLSRDVRVVKKSNELDPAFYLSKYRDVRISAHDPVRHYCEYGWKEGRDPSPGFDTKFYLASNQDVAAAGMNPLVHYIKYGLREGRPARAAGQGPSRDDNRGVTASISRSASGAKLPGGMFSRAVIGLCTLPATFFFYDGLGRWARAVAKGSPFVGEVLRNPAKCRARLARMPIMIRAPVSASLSVALSVRRNGVLRSLHNFTLVLREEGFSGLRTRFTEYVPGSVADAPPGGWASRAEAPRSRILVMDWRIPMADVSAGERATVGILADLSAMGFDVVFVPTDMEPSPEHEEHLRSLGVAVVTKALGFKSVVQYLNETGHTFGAFYLIRVNVAEMVMGTIRKVAPTGKVLFHMPDVHFLRMGREAELKHSNDLRLKADAMKERELAMIRQVDRTVIVSPAELLVLRKYVQDAPISVFPVLYAPVVGSPAPFEARKDIFFLGGYEHSPNVDAVLWFVREIWPLVRQQLSDAVFHIVGSRAPQVLLDLGSVQGVEVDGFVDDLDALLSTMRVGVAPLRFGAGIKGKVAVTMGASIPCVCTSIAAEGLGIGDGSHALVADDPICFAEAVVQLYTDPELWTRLSSGGRELVRRRFGPEANRATLLEVLNEADLLPLSMFVDHCRTLPPRPVPCPTEDEEVDVSVIIPVYNQWESTRACLNSILETCAADEIRYEVILADDGSSDETVRAAGHYPGLRVVRTPENVGFLRNCNHASRQARGRHILLLNNDTIVLPGWMSSLYRLMEEDESAAIVGSKLLYPNGTIQEAGAILWKDATAHNFGRGKPRSAPDCNCVREVDYSSAASILVRKAFWDDVGGFDERYETAYCEDSDLAMAARAAGQRVLYEPESEVVHFEHLTYAEQAPTHNPGLQRRNIAKLAEKWAEAFATRHQPPTSPYHLGMGNAQRSPSPSDLARRERGRLNVMYFSPFPSHPGNHGNQTTIRNFGWLFQDMGHSVHFVLLESDLFTNGDVHDMRSYWDTLDLIPNSHPMVADGNPIPFDGWYEEGLGERIACLCAKYAIDVVFCSYVFQSRLLEFVPAHVLKVIDTHDKMGNRYEMLRANGQPLEFFSCTPEEEGAYLRRADMVVARREEEAHYFDSVTGRTTAIVIPHLEDPHCGHRIFGGPHHVGVVASANRINLAIVNAFLIAVEKRLQGEACPFKVHVAGKVKDMVSALPSSEAQIFRRPWLNMRGFVPDMARFYAEMDLIVSPATMGTGINVKTVQAMAYGMPLLTTLVGSKGIETGDSMHSHPDLDALAGSLLSLTGHPEELERLAALSRSRYATFHESGLAAMRGMFAHPKLRVPPEPGTSLEWSPQPVIVPRGVPPLQAPMTYQADRYHAFTQETLGMLVPTDLRKAKLHSVYPQDSEWFTRCMDALFKIECEYAQELVNDIKRRNVAGAFVEFGVFQGHWVKLMLAMTERAGLKDRGVWGFDSFMGLSRPNPAYDGPFWKEGMYAASRAEVERNLDAANHPRIRLVEGFFAESLKGQEAARLGAVAYARVDCDIYEPAVECLAFLSRRLSHGAVLVFDDWNHDIGYGEARAFAEWVPAVPQLRFEFLCLGPWDHLYLRVWHK